MISLYYTKSHTNKYIMPTNIRTHKNIHTYKYEYIVTCGIYFVDTFLIVGMNIST